jgi:ABC-type sulfate transport system permease component
MFEQAAVVAGVTRVQALTRVALPPVALAISTGAAPTWARSLREFGAPSQLRGKLEEASRSA